VIAPTRLGEDLRQLLALRELRESIAPSDQPIGLHFYRAGDIEFLALLDERIERLRRDIEAKR
jgi:hypothetical protein